jgi:valyl-tRNA synthetase
MTLTAQAAQGRDVKISGARVEGYRNFCTKLWNAARFCQLNGAAPAAGFDFSSCIETVNRWLISKLAAAAGRADVALEGYRFNDYAQGLYQFTWGTFCDWYVEFAKLNLLGGSPAGQAETRAVAAFALDQILKLLHPVIPFVSEELYQALAERRGRLLITEPWPEIDPDWIDATAEAEVDWVIRLISLVRTIRAELNVPPSARFPLLLKDCGPAVEACIGQYQHLIGTLARVEPVATVTGEIPQGAIQDVVDGATVVLPIASVIDVAAERARLAKEISRLENDIARSERKLGDPRFLDRAPAEVIETERERRAEAESARDRLNEAARRLAVL